MIDGKADTSWRSAGDSTGAEILLKFNEPVTVGRVGLLAANSIVGDQEDPADPLSLHRVTGRVAAVTWSFARQDGSQGTSCAISNSDYVHPVHQDVTRGTTMAVSPAITTCSVKVQIDQVRSTTGSGSLVNVAISELILKTG